MIQTDLQTYLNAKENADKEEREQIGNTLIIKYYKDGELVARRESAGPLNHTFFIPDRRHKDD